MTNLYFGGNFYPLKLTVQYVNPTNSIAKEQKSQTEEEIRNLIKKQVSVECDHVQGEFFSPIFAVPKKNGTIRFIPNFGKLCYSVRHAN